MMINHHDRALWVVIFILVFFFVGNFIFTQYEILQLKNNLNTPVQTSSPIVYSPVIQTPFPSQTVTPNSPIPTIIPTSSLKTNATAKPVTQISYIPLTGGSTQNTSWTTINSSQFNFNISDYGTGPNIIWDANLTAQNPNDITYARIFDTTHQIAVSGSQISLTNNSNTSLTQDVVSGSLQFWQGNNTYVVQVMSLNGSTATVGSGRIKITY